MDKTEEKELKELLSEIKKLYKRHIKEGYDYTGFMFEDCKDGHEIQKILTFDRY